MSLWSPAVSPCALLTRPAPGGTAGYVARSPSSVCVSPPGGRDSDVYALELAAYFEGYQLPCENPRCAYGADRETTDP